MSRDAAWGYVCSLQGAAINYQGDPQELVTRFLATLTKTLAKRGVDLAPAESPEQAGIQFRWIQIEQGSQLVRYLLPFIAPAFLELEMDVAAPGGVETLEYRQKAQVGAFGGSARGMLLVCADRLAKRIGKDLARQFL